eukprot:s399_g14.t1
MSGGWVDLDAVGLDGSNATLLDNRGEVHAQDQSKTTCSSGTFIKCEKHRWGRFGQWNLGGQKLDLLDVAGRDLDIVTAQEVSRDEQGWSTVDTELFHWVLHRSPSLWRGVGVGIANDKLDSIVQRVANSRGMWVLARLKGMGRVAIGSMHGHTGATNAIYQAAVLQFVNTCPCKWRMYPVLCGVDVNEELRWFEDQDHCVSLCDGTSNLNELAHDLLQEDIRPVPPGRTQWSTPTHFPRDPTRQGRQIDAVWKRQVRTSDVTIDKERRHVIGSDHALLHVDIFCSRPAPMRWGNDSRARFLCADIPAADIIDADDLSRLARQCSAPRVSKTYKDSAEVRSLIATARATNAKQDWKQVHRIRRQAKRAWQQNRLADILQGDWEQYRQLQKEKQRTTGWWGRMLENSSSKEQTMAVEKHLRGKLVNEFSLDWDQTLQIQLDSIETRSVFAPFTVLDVREVLQEMKVHSAVGPDGIGVSFLRGVMSDDYVGPQVLELVNHIVENLELPIRWEDNFLALLAKCETPLKPGDLRPICVSSVFHKMITKLVCRRTLPLMRRGSKVSGCGKGRQAADIVGTISRIRDVTQEWKLPTLLCKLDISGAFDKLDRQKVVELLKDRLTGMEVDHELRYLIAQLRIYNLHGRVPGGSEITVSPNIGIKQGAPESAEIFGLVMDSLLMRLVAHPKWKALGKPFSELDVELVFYQDDIFIIEDTFARLGRRIKILERTLGEHGLHLAAEKTKIVASDSYKGARRISVGGTEFRIAHSDQSVKVLGISFNLQESPSQQAKEILQRVRSAAAAHKDLLRGRASWQRKANMIRTLVESQFSWIGGALHWGVSDLKQANTIQLQIMRSSFRIVRQQGETWQEWNSRSLRTCRAWLSYNCRPRWSTSILRLQHTLLGHWARQKECVQGAEHASLPMRAMHWKSTEWWRQQQKLSPTVGMRHPARFYASNVERQMAEVHGNRWSDLALDRQQWAAVRDLYLARWDVRWCHGRQLSIRY